ncbi:hypothetical protein SERLA73DRAFT_81670 [Serpula lacrymans var. lacrymans S7.3]|uniref:Uncharacterized protein n=1 Tax=Serpula lacrymans var. lacrymans (strain S7.3) TaxID=936435 RepID=F8QL54_SERL3|nr:hypothetical protein SERLA73DRAFT_81670 [Serpula lacrymans var. lacrymans S7.3]
MICSSREKVCFDVFGTWNMMERKVVIAQFHDPSSLSSVELLRFINEIMPPFF